MEKWISSLFGSYRFTEKINYYKKGKNMRIKTKDWDLLFYVKTVKSRKCIVSNLITEALFIIELIMNWYLLLIKSDISQFFFNIRGLLNLITIKVINKVTKGYYFLISRKIRYTSQDCYKRNEKTLLFCDKQQNK